MKYKNLYMCPHCNTIVAVFQKEYIAINYAKDYTKFNKCTACMYTKDDRIRYGFKKLIKISKKDLEWVKLLYE